MTKHSEQFCLENITAARTNQSAPLTTIKNDSRCYVICRRFFICVLFVAVILLSSIITIHGNAIFAPKVCHSQECLRSAATFKRHMNLSVNPCEDFYSYVCDHWGADHPRPETSKTFSWFKDRQNNINNIIRNQLETNVSRSDPKPVAQAKDMYKACLKSLEPTTKNNGCEVVQQYLQEFGLPAVPTLLNHTKASQEDYEFDWINSVAKIKRKVGLDVLIGFSFAVDHLDRERFRLSLGCHSKTQLIQFPPYEWSALKPKNQASKTSNEEVQKSDTEGDKKDNEKNKDPEKLAETLHRLATLITPTVNTTNVNDSLLTLAETFLTFDKQLPVLDDEPGDKDPAYYTVAELQNITDSRIAPRKPYPVWQHYLDVMFADLPEIKPPADEKFQINARNVEYLSNLTEFLSQQSPELIELYVWKSVTEFLVDHPFNKLKTEENCTETVQKLMGLAVTYTIADKNFLNETKPRLEQMFDGIRSQFNQMILETDWMDERSKNVSIEKSKAMGSLIGFPEWILDVDMLEEHYRGLQVDPSNHFENWVNALQFFIRTELRLFHVNISNVQNTDPSFVNAFNDVSANVISTLFTQHFQDPNGSLYVDSGFPFTHFDHQVASSKSVVRSAPITAAIIQYPFYYLGLEALNYGSLGDILGHELTHGFDHSGRYFDKFCNHGQWWSNDTLEEFDKRTSCLVEQYNSYYVPEAKGYVNGSLTLDENIADNGGTREALRAYRAYVKRNGPEPLLPGFEDFTHEQLFFISFGSQNCATISPFDAEEVLENVHSPPKFRVLGVLSNMEEFSEAFKCPRGSTMNPEKKCRVW